MAASAATAPQIVCVSPRGNDQGPGTEQQPWRTIERGIEMVIARHWDQHRLRVRHAVVAEDGSMRLVLHEPDQVLVRFSEPVEPKSAVHLNHYTLDNGVVIRAIQQLAPDRVAIEVSPLEPGRTYTLTVREVRDMAKARNRIQPDSRVSFAPGNVDLIAKLELVGVKALQEEFKVTRP